MIWSTLIETYENRVNKGYICPIAHTKIIAHIGVMLDESSNILAATSIKQSIFAPCTAKSECRSNNIAPHLIHDNASYVSNINPKRHDAYMGQLSRYVADTKDRFCEIVLKYLQKETICKDLKNLVDLESNPGYVITFGIKGWEENTINYKWKEYHLLKLPQNGICAITGEADYIPDAYPGNIRFPGDMAKLFCTRSDRMDGMSQLRAGYIASQKIIHTLQSFFSDWKEQNEIFLGDFLMYIQNECE